MTNVTTGTNTPITPCKSFNPATAGPDSRREARKERKKMALEPLLQIHHHEGHQDRSLGGDSQLAHDPGQTEAPLALPEFAFDRYPGPFVLTGLLGHGLLLPDIGRGSAQRRTGESNAMVFAKLAVVPGAVDFIGVDRFRIMAKARAVSLYLPDQIAGLVIGIPTDAIHKGDAVNQTGRDLGAKLGGGSGLAAFDRPNMGL